MTITRKSRLKVFTYVYQNNVIYLRRKSQTCRYFLLLRMIAHIVNGEFFLFSNSFLVICRK
jgi:hypothetical protein